MNFPLHINWKSLAITFGLATMVACSDSSDNNRVSTPPPIEPPTEPPTAPAPTYNAEIVWTEYGIPHITAQDWGSLGYGTGYAFSTENYCLAMKAVVRHNGNLSRFFGGGFIAADIGSKLRFADEHIQRLYFDEPDPAIVTLFEGYAAGMNRWLADTGVENLAGGSDGCRDAAWVRKVNAMDVAKVMHGFAYWNMNPSLATFISNVRAPEPTAQANIAKTAAGKLVDFDREQYIASIKAAQHSGIGSNGYAIGADSTQNGAGVVLSNSHVPWESGVPFLMHQTMGDELDAMGVTSTGYPLLWNAFNANVAWAHTFSFGSRFMLYELELNSANPMQYLYNGEWRDIEPRVFSVDYKNTDGSLATYEHTLYFSHFGVILDPGGDLGGWPNALGTVLTLYEPRSENNRGISQLLAMAQAQDVDELKQALSAVGIASMNTLAADRNGDAFFGDISATPHITASQYNNCVRGMLAGVMTDAGFPTLDGTDPECAPGNALNTAEGILDFDSLPQLDTRDYVANANQGHWMINPRQLLDSYPDFLDPYSSVNSSGQLFPRPRQLFLQAEERIAGTDDLGPPGFSVQTMKELLFGSRSIIADHITDDLIDICRAVDDWTPYTERTDSAQQACEILANWDRRFKVESVGAHLFREVHWGWVDRFRTPDLGFLYAVPFDMSDPFRTPRGIVRTEEWEEVVRKSIALGVEVLAEAGVALDTPWGEVQFIEKGGLRYPLHGGDEHITLSMIDNYNYDTGWWEKSWIERRTNNVHGNNYVSVVSWDESECPDAYAVKASSQSSDPDSPHFADGTELYSKGEWIDVPFCRQDIEAQELRRVVLQE